MAKREVWEHPKFQKLCTKLDRPKGECLGWLEATWHLTARFAQQGNIGKFTDDEIEGWMGWRGKPGELVNALVECRFLDRCETHRLITHDWEDHCDEATKKRLIRAKMAFLKPNGRQRQTPGKNGCLPVPVPVPVPEPVPVAAPPMAAAAAIPHTPTPEPEPKPDLTPQHPLEYLPKELQTAGFRKAWGEWEEYHRQTRGVMQPLTRLNTWTELLPLGPEEAARRIKSAIRKGYRNIVTDLEPITPFGKAREPPPPKRKLENVTEKRIAAQQECQRLVKAGSSPQEIKRHLTEHFGAELAVAVERLEKVGA